MMRIPLFLVILCVSAFSSALDITGKIQWNEECPDIKSLRPSKAVLDDGKMKGSILRDGSFSIPNVPVGTYVFSVISPDYSFDQLRVDVPNFNSTPEVRPYVAGTPLNPPSAVLLTYPILLTPKKRHSYFMPHESFNLMAMLSNPMMLMMVAAGAMMLATPYLMKNMDPQTLEDFKEQHAKVTGFQNAVANGDLQTGLSTLTGGEQSKKGASVTSSASSSVKNRGTKNKKR